MYKLQELREQGLEVKRRKVKKPLLRQNRKQRAVITCPGTAYIYYLLLNYKQLGATSRRPHVGEFVSLLLFSRSSFLFAQNKYGVKKRPPPPANCLPLGGSCKSPGTVCCDFCAFCHCRLFRTVCYCRMGNPHC